MNQQDYHYQQVAKAIDYIHTHYQEQPSLEKLAAAVNMSPFHFQRLFTEWAGVSPKNFLQYTTIGYAKELLKTEQASLFDTALDAGLSGTGRLHDLFIKIEGMTPGEFKNGGAHLTLNYSIAETPFGKIIIASSGKGVCYISFCENDLEATDSLHAAFPNSKLIQFTDEYQQAALFVFQQDWADISAVKLHLKGTAFQLKVWDALLRIPKGRLTTYKSIARSIGKPDASRAVGTAIGSNPVAFLIPCHRVIRGDGEIGGYMWGETRKRAIIGWEACSNP